MISNLFKLIRKSSADYNIDEMVIHAQQGNDGLRNDIIREYQPFVIKTVSEVCKRYINPRIDDEFSIGLMALNEAIDTFNAAKGSGFLPFAKVVINRRIIDYIRKQANNEIHLSLDFASENEEIENGASLQNSAVVQTSINMYYKEEENHSRKEEILDFSKKLLEFGISFDDLPKIAPKHKDSREIAIHIAKIIITNDELREEVLTKKRLPIKKIEKYTTVSKKTIERNRKYVLALIVLLTNEYIYIKEFLSI